MIWYKVFEYACDYGLAVSKQGDELFIGVFSGETV